MCFCCQIPASLVPGIPTETRLEHSIEKFKPDGMYCCFCRPNLGLQSWKGSTDNNLIRLALGGGDGGMTTGIYLDETTTDKSQRYKISTGSNGAANQIKSNQIKS